MPNIDSYLADQEVPLPAQKQVILRNDSLQGFVHRVTSGGSKAFIVEGRVNGVGAKVPIGSLPAYSYRFSPPRSPIGSRLISLPRLAL